MSIKRLTRSIVRNKEEIYKEHLRKRGVKHIDHYSTVEMHHPDADDLEDVESLTHVWGIGDRYSKLAYQHYGDPRYWWIIAWYNQLPTESHVSLRDVVYIPTPFDKILALIGG